MRILAFCFLLFIATVSFGQVYEKPAAASQSHADLKIENIEITDTSTIISLSVTNQLQSGGWFCADNNIIIRDSKSSKEFKLTRSENIPVCPQKHEFTKKGEVLHFTLYFPPIEKNTKFIDLIENCSEACFAFEGIILDNIHNRKIESFEKAMDLFTAGKINECIPLFKSVLEGVTTIESHIFGLSYYYLVLSYHSLNDKENADKWYNELKSSNIPLKADIIKELQARIGY